MDQRLLPYKQLSLKFEIDEKENSKDKEIYMSKLMPERLVHYVPELFQLGYAMDLSDIEQQLNLK